MIEQRFICQTYTYQDRGKGKSTKAILTVNTKVECKTSQDAERRAEKMFAGGSYAGVDAFSIEVDIELGDYSEPKFITRLGDVPIED